MAYPSLTVLVDGAGMQMDAGLEIDRATNGAARGRSFYTTAKRRFRFVHRVNSTDRATFDAYFAANVATSFTFTWPGDGATYTCIFSREPSHKPLGASLTEISVELEVV